MGRRVELALVDRGAAPVAVAFRRPGRVVGREGARPRCARWCCRRSSGTAPIEAWIIDDTGFPKHGTHSVGVSHQYCGQLGKQDNCQVAVSLSLANHHASLPVAYRLYLPKSWAEDKKRRTKAGVPDEIEFQTKPKIALDQLAWACAAGLPRGVVLMDCGLWDGRLLASRRESSASTMRSPSTPGRWSKAGKKKQDDGRGARARSAEARVEDDHVARRLSRALALALRARARARPRRGLHARRARGMAADRVAKGREDADEVLALYVGSQTSPSTASSTSP